MLNFFIERPVFSTVIALLMILVGGLTAFSLPIAQYPQVVPPQVTVSTSFPGANADVVAQSVAAPIEQQVNGSQDMLYMGSKSGNDGSYSLTVTFDIGTDKNIDAVEVQNRVAIAQSQLPADVIRNGITVRKSTTDFLEVIALTSPERRYDGVFLSNYALLNLYDALGRVPGVGQVRIFGARDYSMRIWLNPERMARLGVTASDIASVIREQNVVAPAGGLGLPPVPQGQQMQYTVFVKGRLASAAEFENIIIREAGNGQVVRLRDVARVELAAADYSIYGAERRHSRRADRDLPAARCQCARRRQADQAGDGRPGAALSAGHGLLDPLQHDAVRHRVAEGGDEDAVHRLRAGRVRRLPVPAELARDADPDPGRADFADRYLRRLRRAGLFHQHADAVRPGARHRHRRRRRDRRGGSRAAAARRRAA